MKTGPKPRPGLERFEEKFEPVPWSGCWIWTASSTGGYGRFGIGGHFGQLVPASRMAWRLYRGEIPEGLEVAHTCDVGFCVNPAHLWLATHAENMADMIAKGRNRPGRVFGDRNGSRIHRERMQRGDQ